MAINFKKKKAALVATLALGAVLAFGLAGCGAQSASSDKSAGSSDDKTITVAATPSPHAEILNDAVKPLLEKEGYTLEVKEFTDYVQPNTVTEEGEVERCRAAWFACIRKTYQNMLTIARCRLRLYMMKFLINWRRRISDFS